MKFDADTKDMDLLLDRISTKERFIYLFSEKTRSVLVPSAKTPRNDTNFQETIHSYLLTVERHARSFTLTGNNHIYSIPVRLFEYIYIIYITFLDLSSN